MLPPLPVFLQRPNKASALHLYSCTVSGRLTRTCGEDTTVFTGWVEPTNRAPPPYAINTPICRRGKDSTTTTPSCRICTSTPPLPPRTLINTPIRTQIIPLFVESGEVHPPPSICRPGIPHYPASLLPQVVTATLLTRLYPPATLPRSEPPCPPSPPAPLPLSPQPPLLPPTPLVRVSGPRTPASRRARLIPQRHLTA